MKNALIISFFICCIISCNDIDNCASDANTENVIILFFDKDSPSELKNVFYSFQAEKSEVRFLFDSTNLIYDNDTTIFGQFLEAGDTIRLPIGNSAALPFNPLMDNVTFLFYLPDGTVPDTLSLSYNREFSVFDPVCPASVAYVNIDTLHHTFDSLAIPAPILNIQLDTNIEIYL